MLWYFLIASASYPLLQQGWNSRNMCSATCEIITCQMCFPFSLLSLCLYVDQPYKCSNHTDMYAQLAISYNSYNNFSILLYLATRVSECYTNADCTGNQVAVTNQRQCCVWTNDGLSYSDGSSCTVCRGKSWCKNNGVLSIGTRHLPTSLLVL